MAYPQTSKVSRRPLHNHQLESSACRAHTHRSRAQAGPAGAQERAIASRGPAARQEQPAARLQVRASGRTERRRTAMANEGPTGALCET